MLLLSLSVGILVGILLATIALTVGLIYRTKIEQVARHVEAQTAPKGLLIPAPTENEVAVKEVIERNDKEGQDTKIGDLL